MPAYLKNLPRVTLLNEGEDTLKQTIREVILHGREGLWYLLRDVLMHPQVRCDGKTCCDKTRWFYEPLHREWCRWAQDDGIQFKGLLAPRGHGKSTVLSYSKSIHAILTNPNIRILLVSALEKNAHRFCEQVKRAFTNNPRMEWLFPEWCVPARSQFGNQEEFTSPARTDHTLAAPTFTAAYIDAAHASQHYDLEVIDDPIEAKHVATEDQASKSYAAFDKLEPLLDPGGRQLLCGTRWAYYDLYSIHLPVELGGNAVKSTFDWRVYACLQNAEGKPDFEHGEPIFPTVFPREELMRRLARARNNPEQGETFWWNQYMNMCRAPAEAPFLDEWFAAVPENTVPPLFGRTICIDTALKDDTRPGSGDYSVILVGGWDKEGRLYIYPEALWSNKMRSKEFLQNLVALSQRYQAPTVVKQRVSEDTFGTQIRDAFAEARVPLDYRPIVVQGMGRKQQRIKDALQGPMERREIFWMQPLASDGVPYPHRLLKYAKKELVNLGQYALDDIADALANFYHPEVRVRRQNLVGQTSWRVPHAPVAQLGNAMQARWRAMHGPTERAQ